MKENISVLFILIMMLSTSVFSPSVFASGLPVVEPENVINHIVNNPFQSVFMLFMIACFARGIFAFMNDIKTKFKIWV